MDDLLDLSQIKSGVFNLVKEPIDIVSIIESVCSIFRPQVASKKLLIEAIFDCQIPTLVGDSRRLKQVLLNLVKNAIKFTE